MAAEVDSRAQGSPLVEVRAWALPGEHVQAVTRNYITHLASVSMDPSLVVGGLLCPQPRSLASGSEEDPDPPSVPSGVAKMGAGREMEVPSPGYPRGAAAE